MDGLSLVTTWSKPFSLEGEELSYVIFITGNSDLIQDDEVTVNETEYKFYSRSKPIEEVDCTQFIMFTVFSENEYSRSIANVSEWKKVPTGITHNTENQYSKYHLHEILYHVPLLASCSSCLSQKFWISS